MNCRNTRLGVALGVATGNLALGLCVGNAIGDMKKEDFKDTMRDVSSLFKWVKRMFYRVRWAGLPVILFSAMFADAAPTFVTPEMTYRRGLTDAQYEHLWKIGRNPKIEPAAAREWMFKSYRFGNTTNWLNIVGRTNDFAKLSYVLQDENFKLEETNAVVVAENGKLWRTNAVIVAENEYLIATNAVLEVDAKKAQKVEKAADKAKKKDQKNFEKWVKDTEKAKAKSSDEMAEFYDAVLEIAHAYESGS